MSQVTAALVIADGQATPVNKTFSPERVAPDQSYFTERSAVSSNGFIRLGASFDPASAKRTTNRVRITLSYPIIESVSGINQVTRTLRFDGTFVIPDNATAAERANLQAFVANGLANAQIKAIIKDLDPLY